MARLHIFMRRLTLGGVYLDCTTAVEDIAARLDTPVVVEGYSPL